MYIHCNSNIVIVHLCVGDVNSIAVSETGVYVEATTSGKSVVSHYTRSGHLVQQFEHFIPSDNDDSDSRWFDITSPGSQPLPERTYKHLALL